MTTRRRYGTIHPSEMSSSNSGGNARAASSQEAVSSSSNGNRAAASAETAEPAPAPANDKMRTLEKAVFQILSAHGCLRAADLEGYVETMQADLAVNQPVALPTLFSSMNRRLRDICMEVKTVVMRSTGRDAEDVYYHGLANIDEDFVAKEHASPFKPEELAFFTDLASKLLQQTTMSTHDVVDLKPDKWTATAVHALLTRFQSHAWLARDDRDYWRLAPRSFIELSAYFEGLLLNSNELEDVEDEDERRRQLARRMPQLLMY